MDPIRRLMILGLLAVVPTANAELKDPPGVKPLSQTFAVRQGAQQLATFGNPEACEADARARTSNPGQAIRTFLVKTGGGAVVTSSPTLAECLTATQQRLRDIGETQVSGSNVNRCEATTKYSSAFQPPICLANYNYSAQYQPTATTPPPTCSPPPAPQAGRCPAGTYGAWLSTASVGPAPECAITWSPAPAGTCQPNPTCNCPEPEPEVPATPVLGIAPNGLTATLAWPPALAHASAYSLEKCRGEGCTNFTELVRQAGLTYSDTLPAGATARYRVRGVSETGGFGAYSNVQVFIGVAPNPPDPTAPIACSNRVCNVVWTPGAPVANAAVAGFRVVYGRQPTELVYSAETRNPAHTNISVTVNATGIWYFGIISFTANGTDSVVSNVIARTVQ